MAFLERQHRVRVLQAMDRAVRQFRTREGLWPLRVPNAPLSLDELVDRAVQEGRFDPLSVRSQTLLWLRWEDGSTWELWRCSLPSGLKVYCDTGDGESRMLATGRRDSEIDTDRLLLERFSETAGHEFGVEMHGGPPSRVSSPLDPELVVEFFLNLFEVLELEAQVRGDLAARGDFRADVERWLRTAGVAVSDAGP